MTDRKTIEAQKSTNKGQTRGSFVVRDGYEGRVIIGFARAGKRGEEVVYTLDAERAAEFLREFSAALAKSHP